MPAKGTINLHGSLLPQYRGAAPINHVIINGETETGVTTFFLKQEIDTGDVIFSDSTEITPNETAGSLHDKLMVIGANLLDKLGGFIPERESETIQIYAPKREAKVRIGSNPFSSRILQLAGRINRNNDHRKKFSPLLK